MCLHRDAVTSITICGFIPEEIVLRIACFSLLLFSSHRARYDMIDSYFPQSPLICVTHMDIIDGLAPIAVIPADYKYVFEFTATTIVDSCLAPLHSWGLDRGTGEAG
jgi:hypothetical protein